MLCCVKKFSIMESHRRSSSFPGIKVERAVLVLQVEIKAVYDFRREIDLCIGKHRGNLVVGKLKDNFKMQRCMAASHNRVAEGLELFPEGIGTVTLAQQ